MSPTRTSVIAGRYELTGEVLASGGMGRVVAGRDSVLDRPVAIKLLSGDLGNAPGAGKRFRSEAVTAARLSHPNVVSVYDAGEHEGHPYIVMERLSGRTLADELSEGPLAQDRALDVAAQVLSALHAAHEAGVLHRDVKPRNVLIADDGSARLSDFGIAKLLDHEATRTRDLLGTPAYVAPELLEGRAASVRSDLYSVGIMLFEMLAGRKPFPGEPSVAHLAAVQSGSMPSVQDVAPWVDDRLAGVVKVATSRDPAARFASAAEMELAVRAARTSDGGTDATRPLPLATQETIAMRRPAPAPVRRVRRWIIASAAFAIAVGAALALLASQSQPETNRSPAPGNSAPASTVLPLIELPPSLFEETPGDEAGEGDNDGRKGRGKGGGKHGDD